MRRYAGTVVGLLAMGLAPLAAAEPRGEGRYLEAIGTGTVKVKPDSARISFGVLSGMPTIKEVRDENAKTVKKVSEALDALKVQGMEVKVLKGDLGLVFANPIGGVPDLAPMVTGYKVLTTFTVTVSDKDPEKLRTLANKVLDTAVENGANSGGVMSATTYATPTAPVIEYFLKDATEARRQAAAKAAEDALATIKAVAAGAKVEHYETVLVSVVPDFAPPAEKKNNEPAGVVAGFFIGGPGMGAGSTQGKGVASPSDEIEVTAKVMVRCKF